MRDVNVEKVYPNCFAARLEGEEEDNINIVFGNAQFDNEGSIAKDKDVEIVSDININKEGLKVILKGLIDLAEEYNKKYNIDILGEIIEDFEEVGEENETSKK